ncbi:kinesin-domain-containing protein [Auriculariales sp. MPI-PUGE-AT-0066]|nr:kinesin-domain-containing protein [Auriculariales sp. MPI-PUGE-AT-0066]
MAPAGSTSVQVALRIRPTTSQDAISIPARFQRTVIHATASNSVSVDATNPVPASAGGSQAQQSPATAAPAKKQTFNFDHVLSQAATQHSLYMATAHPLIERFVEGFNCTILAYGQTSSGKTYSMTGIDLDGDPTDPSNGMGITPRSIAEIFARCRALRDERGAGWNFTIKGSFIELYNEDLIDLLVPEGAGGRRDVQIREDKDGTIIWGGLREVEVRNPKEVMNLIRSGSSLRRTNETDMNAQSSRSHAIFSLTLIQRKHSGGGNPGGRATPISPPSASRIARPGSVSIGGSNSRVSSPTFGRPQTPSFATAMGRGGKRPGSAMGQNDRPGTPEDDGPGEWSTIVSKFHFVDLAGSERLKRTAAAGERAKEGISINSGLLALGNVISALGDPGRAKAVTHIPYRDSKLTRLLQDSLGGNAHTLMIACVSPAEWNAAETINTLKYANRARNIKNRAEIREKEEGWDDLDWLQNMVTRLRKEVKGLKDGGAIPSDGATTTTTPAVSAEGEGSSKKMLAQVVELQENYQELRERYVERTEELTRLRRELGEQHRGSGGAAGGMGKYEEIVGPVIEEYEKTISAIEAELKLNRAALRHTNELVAEKEEEFSELSERHSKTESYVEELRTRISRVTERESSTESYIHDLEEKIKNFDDSSLSSSSSVSELKKEISKFKETETHSAQYIAELETRLARSDESVLTLRATVEKLEYDAEARRAEVELLQTRLEGLKTDGEGWRSELEARERKVAELERQLMSWEERRREAGLDRERLGDLMNGIEQAKNELEKNIDLVREASSHEPSVNGSKPFDDQLINLQQTHTATLADLSTETRTRSRRGTVSVSRSREGTDGNITPSPSRRRFFRHAASSDSLHARSQSQSQSLSQELSSARSPKHSSTRSLTSPGSTGNLRVPSRASSPIPPVPPLHLHINNERSTESLEKEIMRLQEVLKEREAEIVILEQNLKVTPPRTDSPDGIAPEDPTLRPAGTLSPKTISQFEEIRRSVIIDDNTTPQPVESESLDRLDELMRSMAQKESTHREKVDKLESQLKGQENDLKTARKQLDELTALSRDQALNMSNELEGLRAQLQVSEESHLQFKDEAASFKSREAELVAAHAEQIRLAEERHANGQVELDRLRAREIELLSAHDRHTQTASNDQASLTSELDNLKRRETELLAAQAASEQQHNDQLQSLREENDTRLKAKSAEVDDLLAKIQRNEADIALARNQLAAAAAALTAANEEHALVMTRLREDHTAELAKRTEEIDHLREDLHSSGQSAQRREAEHSEALVRVEAKTAAQLDELRKEHAAELQRTEAAREGLLSDSQENQLAALRELEVAHAAALKEKESSLSSELEATKTDQVRVLASLAADHEAALSKAKDQHERTLASESASHASALERLAADHATALTSQARELGARIANLQNEHSFALSSVEESHASALRQALSAHTIAAQDARQEQLVSHAQELNELRSTHATELSALEQRLNSASSDALSKHAADVQALNDSHQSAFETARANLLQDHQEELNGVRMSHEQQLAALAAAHETTLRDAEQTLVAAHQAQLHEARQAHERELQSVRDEHAVSLRASQDALSSAQNEHASVLENTQSAHEQVLSEERDHQVEMLAELDAIHTREHNSLKKDMESIQEENTRLKAEIESVQSSVATSASTSQQKLLANAQSITALQADLAAAKQTQSALASQVTSLQDDLQLRTAEVQRYQPLAREAVDLKAELERVRDELQNIKSEAELLQSDKSRQDLLIKDLHAQIASLTQARASPSVDRQANFVRSNSGSSRLPPATPPPSGPPPSVPPPPIPSDPTATPIEIAKRSALARSSDSSRGSIPDSPAATISTTLTSLPSTNGHADSKIVALLEEKEQTIEEQDTMIRTLNKQLTHCESDLQAHMDLVSTLETSLSESERNLRKARMQSTDLAKERDTLKVQVDGLRSEVQDAKSEVATVRRSVVEEKLTLENRLDEERRAKERARAQLDSRMEELQRRKSKFICL